MQRRIRAASLAAALLLAACARQAPAPAIQATPVHVAVVANGSGTAPMATSGIVSFDNEMKLAFKFGGVVKRVTVREGQHIRSGEALAEIELAEIDAQVEQARQMADKAARDLARGERLQAEQVISLEQLQDLRTQASIAAATQRAADFNRRLAVIRAPADGIVLRRLVEPSELVPAGQPALVVAGSGAGIIVKAALADRDMARLKLGDAATIGMDAFPGRQFDGSVAMISGAADPATGLFPIEVMVRAPPSPIASGMVARLKLLPEGGRASRLLHVPLTAIVEADGDKAFVYVVRDGHAVRRAVSVAFIDADSVALIAGVAAGESVVTDGALYLADNEALRIVP
jgi:membrane fusion protein, multidrug efflux system